eukprot:CAMPEP_0175054174 /NCGR_PEP_ID=MMETSP0052_2-20121109/9355_1 /TAXON_ID=51329 ORGANISM="Polytomella parva, Strain SAG 63-3" /NCGR_SAMPLE_ID=MMETSP0052_2 /ASSEMBLY_ACC=CAM_ASM_000194 /LENGTH=58 /DNA_ID=CAMNT_0016318833 /DNA_START=34 /DNA_END=206 /DNA_ORIENTATION=-
MIKVMDVGGIGRNDTVGKAERHRSSGHVQTTLMVGRMVRSVEVAGKNIAAAAAAAAAA